jgi:hypothetical protein
MPPTLPPSETLELVAAADAPRSMSRLAEPIVPMVGVPMDTRGIALKILAVIAVVGALALAQTFFVSLLLGIIIAYTLNPLVVYLVADQGSACGRHDHRDGGHD